jgi:hypothetical protein
MTEDRSVRFRWKKGEVIVEIVAVRVLQERLGLCYLRRIRDKT